MFVQPNPIAVAPVRIIWLLVSFAVWQIWVLTFRKLEAVRKRYFGFESFAQSSMWWSINGWCWPNRRTLRFARVPVTAGLAWWWVDIRPKQNFALRNAHGKVCVEKRTWQSWRWETHMARNVCPKCLPEMFFQNVCPTTPYCSGACEGAPGAQAVDFTKCYWSLLISRFLTFAGGSNVCFD